ncbi:MAG: cache domain-containing protein [Planctomycetota bacterium]|jgi:C4-dicarboxylate-specific signal transduction histidine kinase
MTRRFLGTTLLCLLCVACKSRSKPAEPEPPALDEVAAAMIADELDQALMRSVVACRALAENARIRAFFVDGEEPHRVLTVLRDLVMRSRAMMASLLDNEGVVIASTDPGRVGYDFSQWRFFEEASRGRIVILPSVGFASDRRDLFVIVPVKGEDGEPHGAAVLQTPVGPLDRALEGLPEPSAVVFRDRYVLATNRPRWGFHGLRRLDERGATVDLDDRDLLGVLDSVVPPIGETVESEGVSYDVHRWPMCMDEWHLLVCVPRDD